MSVELRFLGWDAPAASRVREFLLPEGPAGPVDLAGDLIVVPTNQAGRRLREALALHCAGQGTALFPPRVLTPGGLLKLRGDGDGAVAAPLESAAAWADVLVKADLGRCGGLFPAGAPSQDFLWALRTGEMIEGLRSALADGGLRLEDVLRDFGHLLEEAERWQDLRQLEKAYLERLSALGMEDRCLRMLQDAEGPGVPGGAERIVLAVVPDPTPLLVRKLERLAERMPVVILVHAPGALAGCFDTWGRPLPEGWRERPIDIPDPGENILLCGPPWSQSRKVLEIMAREAGRFGPADVALGVPDEGVIPFLEADLEGAGLVPFNPAGRPAARHPLVQALQLLRDVCANGDYRSASAMLRNSDFLESLQRRHGIPPGRVLEELDQCQNRHLPQSLDDLARACRGPAPAGGQDGFPCLAEAAGMLMDHMRAFGATGVDAWLRSFLQALYESRTLDSGRPQDSDFMTVAEAVNEGLQRLSRGPLAAMGLEKTCAMELLLWSLAREACYPEPEEAVIGLEGWLELPWNDAPFLIVTGMNDGKVPESHPADVFLPDSLRRRLGLRHDDDRLARDACLMASLIETRREGGRACFIVGKTGAGGDVLRPSRLLFRCNDAGLPGRAGQLFATPAEARAGHPSSISFRLEAAAPPDLPAEGFQLKRIRVTDFRDYLHCPFRYYLKHVLGMKTLDDQKTEMDAMDFGSLVHDALHRMALDDEMRRTRDVDRLQRFLCARAADWVTEQFGPSPPLQVEVQLESARQRLRQAARVQAGLLAEGWEIMHAEMAIRGELEGVQVRGKVDRIDRHRETGQTRLLDYKTSGRAGAPEAAHLGPVPAGGECRDYARIEVAGRQRRWTDLQVPLYAILLSAGTELRGPSEQGYFNLPAALDDTGVVLWTGLTAAVLESAHACARGVITDIKDHRFWPPAPRTAQDEFGGLFWADPALCVNAEAFQSFLRGEERA